LQVSVRIYFARIEMASAKAPAISYHDICNISFRPVWLDKEISS
jgi:hypothetical protein